MIPRSAGYLIQTVLLAAACCVASWTLAAAQADRIGPEDVLIIQAQDVSDIPDKPIRVDKQGFIDIPLVGRLEAGGKTAPEVAAMIVEKLQKFVRDPQVSVSVSEYHSAPVSVLGEVNAPGVYQLTGPKRLMEVISLAGGLRPDAGALIEITREASVGELSILGAKPDATGRFYTARVNIYDLTSGRAPALNIQMMPNDVVAVAKAELVYVIGEVKKAGGFTLKANEQMTVLQAVALAEGMERTAAPAKAKILRTTSETGERAEIPVNINKILANQSEDIKLRPEDILVIPNNEARSVALRATEVALQVATGIVIFRR